MRDIDDILEREPVFEHFEEQPPVLYVEPEIHYVQPSYNQPQYVTIQEVVNLGFGDEVVTEVVPDQPGTVAEPKGALESVDIPSRTVRGWAYDQDNPGASIQMHFYVDAPAGSGRWGGNVFADIGRDDVNAALGITGRHGFLFPIPNEFWDGQRHTLYAYAIDSNGQNNREISGSRVEFQITPEIATDGGDFLQPPPGVVPTITTTTTTPTTTTTTTTGAKQPAGEENLIFGYPQEYVIVGGFVALAGVLWMTSK